MCIHFPSYRNHILYLTVCGSVLCCWIPVLLWETTSLFHYVVRGMGCLFVLWWMKHELVYLWLRRRLPPGDSGYPLIGNTVALLRNAGSFFKYKFALYNNDGGSSPFFTSNFMFQPTVFFVEDADVTWWLTQERKGNLVPWMPPHVVTLMGPTSIITSHGAFHRRLRRLMEPAFSKVAIQNYITIMDGVIMETLQTWCVTSSSELNKSLGRQSCADLSMRLLVDCAFPKIDPNLCSELKHNTQLWMDGMTDFLPFHLGKSRYNKGVIARERLDDILTQVVTSVREEKDENHTTLLGRLCNAKDDTGKFLSHQELLDNLLMLILAGHDAIGGTLGNILHRQSMLPEHQKEALRMEAADMVGDASATSIVNRDAPLITAFLAEMWRLDPPAAFHGAQPTKTLEYKRATKKKRSTSREGNKDDMETTTYSFPKGVGLYATMQDCLIDSVRFPNAIEFRLERFLPRDHPLVTKSASFLVTNIDCNSLGLRYRSFGIGAHTCLGHRFAKQVCRLFLVRLLLSYHVAVLGAHLETVPSQRWNTTFQLRERKEEHHDDNLKLI